MGDLLAGSRTADIEGIWTVILAGGDDTRLHSLSHTTGGRRPNQFCPLFGGESLLDRTRRRVDLVARFDRQVIAVIRPHEAHYRYLDQKLMPGRLVVQPANRGTAPGVVYSLLRVADLAGDVPVAVLPSDHYVSDEVNFMQHVRLATQSLLARPDLVVLLGIVASAPEQDYGWIEPDGAPLPINGAPMFPVVRFWEKPTTLVAQRLMIRGCLWNSFVMVGWLSAFLELIKSAAPDLITAFDRVRAAMGSRREPSAVDALYDELPPVNFSHRVLERASGRLAVTPVTDVEWCDWGSPQRVVATLLQIPRSRTG